MDSHNLHRRRSSKDEDENIVLVARPMEELEPVQLVMPPPPPRNRVQSSPTTAPFKPGGFVKQPLPPPSSPFRSSFTSPGHARTRSISSTAFSPPIHSPLASSFSASSTSSPTLYPFPSSSSSSSSPSPAQPQHPSLPSPVSSSSSSSRRHSRLHSRNLSIFFPRPGSLPQSTIDEDGAQELELHVPDEEAPVSVIPSAGSSISLPPGSRRTVSSAGATAAPHTPLGAGFTFGGRPPASSGPTPSDHLASNRASSARRGHHHKHSMSHSFFSFLEPGTGVGGGQSSNSNTNGVGVNGGKEDLHTQPTPMPVSPWAPISAFPQSAKLSASSSGAGFPPHSPVTANGHSGNHSPSDEEDSLSQQDQQPPSSSLQRPTAGALPVSLMQLALGAWLWVHGQQIGSLSVTGLGYWVVFDAIGVGVLGPAGGGVPQWLGLGTQKGPGYENGKGSSRPYGNAPLQTVLMFSQAVYLMFSAVYVCKETVEHLLLSAGGGEGHHHHPGDEDEGVVGIDFPVILMFITLLSIVATALLYDNHSRLVNVTNNRIPPPRAILRYLLSPSSRRSRLSSSLEYSSQLSFVLCNPFVASPLIFALGVLVLGGLVPSAQQQTSDLVLAAFITIVTFNLALRACTILGTVLLQTAPSRGTVGGRMEAFLRAMREIERHPQVLHLPAPHIWQLTPTSATSLDYTKPTSFSVSSESLVVTMELHVRRDLGDDDVLELTRWAWEKCANALVGGGGLGRLRVGAGGGGLGVPEVTVGVVRG